MRKLWGVAILALSMAGGAALAQGSGRTAEQRGAAFDAADANHDGKLSREEFAHTPRGQPPNDPEANWNASDKDGDGFVSRKEFIEPMIGEDPSSSPAPPAARPSNPLEGHSP